MSGCKIREDLAANYSKAVDIWTTAVSQLGSTADLTDDRYREIIAALNEARDQAQQAKQLYLDHVAAHNCK